jgi:hypothetical protein
MWDISIAGAGALLMRTLPFLLLRTIVYFGIAAAFSVAASGGAGIGWGIGAIVGTQGRIPGAFWGAIGGLAFVGGILWWLREYLLYFVEASHAAAMALALERTHMVAGPGGLPAAMTALQRRFRDAAVLSSADRLVQGTLRQLAALFDPLASILPDAAAIPRSLSEAGLRNTLGFVGRVMLVHPVKATGRAPWSSLQDTLVLLAQNHERLLRNAVLLAAGTLGLSVAAFFVALIPAWAVAAAYPGGSVLITILLALIFAWVFKRAVIEPAIVAAFLDLYVRTIAGQEPEPDWETKLAETSEDFREIKARAARGARRAIIV